MIDSHVHLIHEDNDRWISQLVRRMTENGVRSSVLFGSQMEVSPPDSATRDYVEKYPGYFIPFLVNSADIYHNESLERCIRELESGFWKGVGELMLWCTDTTPMHITFSDGREQDVAVPFPAQGEEHPLYKALFEFCGERHLPVLVHCREPDVMERALQKHPRTRFLWAHVDHGYYCDVGRQLMAKYPNLYCEFGAEFRFRRHDTLGGTDDEEFQKHIDRWRRTCRDFPSRVVWGQDLFRWKDVDHENYRDGIRAWDVLARDLSAEEERSVSEGNLLGLIGMAEPSNAADGEDAAADS